MFTFASIAARRSLPLAARLQHAQARSLVTATKPTMDSHAVFNPPFTKLSVGLVVFGVAAVGMFVPVWTVVYQNKKHGFPQKD